MRKLVTSGAATLMVLGALGTAGIANAGQTLQPTQDQVVVEVQPPRPSVQLLDCYGTTGNMGCGPGWFWRDGWRGWACYPC